MGAGISPRWTVRCLPREEASGNSGLRSATREDRTVAGRPGQLARLASLGAARRREGELFGFLVNFVSAGAFRSWFEALLFVGNEFRAKNGSVEGRVRRSRSESCRVHEMHRSSSAQTGSVHFMHPTRDRVASAFLEMREQPSGLCQRPGFRSQRDYFCVIRVIYVAIGAIGSRCEAVLSFGNGLETKTRPSKAVAGDPAQFQVRLGSA